MAISHTDHLRLLPEFVSTWNEYFLKNKDNKKWQLFEKNNDMYATLRYLNKDIWHHISITFDHSYSLPKLWFNGYNPGTILTRVELEPLLEYPEFASQCSEGEHPFLGVAFYYVDPCRILSLLQQIEEETPRDNTYYYRWYSAAVHMTKLQHQPVEFIK